ncbi:DUF1904 family protein [Brevibacillus sp. SAFN-007a]|uniref:DUF1904 family protein n=1 Tax=Brevibacillus sp. SAFN-007a TaxID=3436862 RepID=UPI003F7E45E9
MPFLRFKGFEKEKLQSVSPLIIEEFARIAEVSREKVKLELLLVERLTNSPLSLEIMMFPRDQKQHDEIARAMNRILHKQGFENVHIFFILLSPALYYKEGLPLRAKVSS